MTFLVGEVVHLKNEIEQRENRIREIQSACDHVFEIKLKDVQPNKRRYVVECSKCDHYLGTLEDYV